MFSQDDEIEVRKAGDRNDGRAGKVAAVLPPPLAWQGTDAGRRYDIAFEGGMEHGEYFGRELVKVAPIGATPC